MGIDDGHTGPARLRVNTLERLMLLIIGDGRDGGLGLFGESADEVDGRSDSVADEKNHRTSLKPADRLVDVTDRKDSDAVEPEPFERVLERLGHVLDNDDDRRGAGCGGA